MCFNDHLGLKHADAQSLLLCGLKWTEQCRSHELRTHPTTIVSHRNDCPLIISCGLNSNFPVGSHGIARVQQQIVDHTTKMIGIKSHLWLQTKISHHLYVRSAVQSPDRIIDKGIKVHLSQIKFETSQRGETA